MTSRVDPEDTRLAGYWDFNDDFGAVVRDGTRNGRDGVLRGAVAGGRPIQAKWPVGDRNLRFSEKREMQERLTRAGFDTEGIDGIIGPPCLTWSDRE